VGTEFTGTGRKKTEGDDVISIWCCREEHLVVVYDARWASWAGLLCESGMGEGRQAAFLGHFRLK
jgi:hypothetical protein